MEAPTEARNAVTQKSDEVAIETPQVSGYSLFNSSLSHYQIDQTLVPLQLLTP